MSAIRQGEKLELLGFTRTPTALVWLAHVRRESGDIAFIPTSAAVQLKLVRQIVVDKLYAQTTPEKIEAETKRMERQASLNEARHRDEVLDNIARWTKAYWYAPGFGVAFALIEEAWPGAGARMAEEVVDHLCKAPLTAVPAWLVGACEGRTPWWIPWAVGVAGVVAVGVGVAYVKPLIPRRRAQEEEA